MSHNVLKTLLKSNRLSAVQASPEKIISRENYSASLRNFFKSFTQPSDHISNFENIKNQFKGLCGQTPAPTHSQSETLIRIL